MSVTTRLPTPAAGEARPGGEPPHHRPHHDDDRHGSPHHDQAHLDAPAGRFDRWSDPVLVLAAAATLALGALVPHAARSVVTLPLALVLPGHAVLAALGRPDRRLPGGGRLALRTALSLAVLSLVVLGVGLVADVERLPVVTGTWTAITLCALAAWRQPLPARVVTSPSALTQSGVLLGLATLATVAVLAAALVLLPEPRQEPYSRLALAGGSREAERPLTVTSAADPEIAVEVDNGTGRRAEYRVIPAIDGGRAWDAPSVVLDPGERRKVTVGGPLPDGACTTRLTIALSVDGKESGVAPLVLYVRNEAGAACG